MMMMMGYSTAIRKRKQSANMTADSYLAVLCLLLYKNKYKVEVDWQNKTEFGGYDVTSELSVFLHGESERATAMGTCCQAILLNLVFIAIESHLNNFGALLFDHFVLLKFNLFVNK